MSGLIDGNDSLISFNESINRNVIIERLSIINSSIRDIGISNLCNCLRKMKLLELNISGNELSGISMINLSENLSVLSCLDLLCLSNCGINDSDINHLMNSIQSIRRLNIFDLSSIYIKI